MFCYEAKHSVRSEEQQMKCLVVPQKWNCAGWVSRRVYLQLRRTLCSQLNTHDMLILNACLISKSCWSDACHCVCVQTSRSRPAPSSTRWSWSATVARWASPSPALRSPLTPSSSQAWPRGVSLRGESRTGQTGRLPKHPCDRETPAHTHSLSLHSKAWIWNDFWLCIS